MTIEMQGVLEREMDDALAITEPERRSDAVLTVLSHQLKALVDCQRKTSDRVKTLVAEAERKAERVKGFKYAIEVGKIIVSLGGGAALMKYFGGAA